MLLPLPAIASHVLKATETSAKKMRIASSLFVAAVLVRGGHTHRILQDVPIAGLSSIETIESSSRSSVLSLESSSSSDSTTTDVPIVGLGSMETIESSSSSGLSSEPSSSSDSTTTGTMYTEEELVAALEVDERFTGERFWTENR